MVGRLINLAGQQFPIVFTLHKKSCALLRAIHICRNWLKAFVFATNEKLCTDTTTQWIGICEAKQGVSPSTKYKSSHRWMGSSASVKSCWIKTSTTQYTSGTHTTEHNGRGADISITHIFRTTRDSTQPRKRVKGKLFGDRAQNEREILETIFQRSTALSFLFLFFVYRQDLLLFNAFRFGFPGCESRLFACTSQKTIAQLTIKSMHRTHPKSYIVPSPLSYQNIFNFCFFYFIIIILGVSQWNFICNRIAVWYFFFCSYNYSVWKSSIRSVLHNSIAIQADRNAAYMEEKLLLWAHSILGADATKYSIPILFIWWYFRRRSYFCVYLKSNIKQLIYSFCRRENENSLLLHSIMSEIILNILFHTNQKRILNKKPARPMTHGQRSLFN